MTWTAAGELPPVTVISSAVGRRVGERPGTEVPRGRIHAVDLDSTPSVGACGYTGDLFPVRGMEYRPAGINRCPDCNATVERED